MHCLSETIRFGPNRIVSDQLFRLLTSALYLSIAFFKVASSKGLRSGSAFRIADFSVCRGLVSRFRYSIGEMFTQVFQDSRLLAREWGSYHSGTCIGFDDLDHCVGWGLGGRAGGIGPP